MCIIVYVYVYFVVCISCVFLCSFFIQYFDTVGWVACKNRFPYNLYCVGGDVIPQYNYTVIIYYSINQSINPSSVIIIVADQYTAQSINQYFFRVA